METYSSTAAVLKYTSNVLFSGNLQTMLENI